MWTETLHRTFMDAQPMPSMLLDDLWISQLGPSAHSANRPSRPNPGASLGTSQQKQSFELSARTCPPSPSAYSFPGLITQVPSSTSLFLSSPTLLYPFQLQTRPGLHSPLPLPTDHSLWYPLRPSPGLNYVGTACCLPTLSWKAQWLHSRGL